MRGADVGDLRHLLQRERFLQTITHHLNDALHGLVMRGCRRRPHVVHLIKRRAEIFGGGVNADRIHKSHQRLKPGIKFQSLTKFVRHGHRDHSFTFALHACDLLFSTRYEFF